MKKALLLALAANTALASPGGSVARSKHDFSDSGPEEYKGRRAGSPCAFCHASHRAPEVLSNRPDSTLPQRPYESSSMKGRAATPDGASRACLSCHDGTVAVGATRNRDAHERSDGRGERPIDPSRKANLGTDLRGSHPISLRPSGGGRDHAPLSGDAVQLDPKGEVQCTSCHDPHREDGDPTVGKFLVMPVARSALCLSCHEAATFANATAAHVSSSAALPHDVDPAFTSVAEAGCLACHAVHGALPDTELVIRGPAGDDDSACLRCHETLVGASTLAADLAKPYSHRIAGEHDAAEGPDARGARLPESSPGARRHAACVDCHDPHQANDTPAQRPFAGGALAGVWGIDLNGQRVEPVRYEYEVCLKCHGDSANKPQSNGPTPPETVRRAVIDVNLRRVFAPTAASSHPVATTRRRADLPGLKGSWSEAAGILCSDCHRSDSTEARGPHGSSQPHLLALPYLTSDGTPEGPLAYALCYQCHDRDVLLSDTSPPGSPASSWFPQHRAHLVKGAVPCSACHASHGISDQAGDPIHNAHLVDFDVSIVSRSPTGQRAYTAAGPHGGSCNLTCHGRVHDNSNATY